MAALNYNHLRYFWAVAREGNLTRAAEKLLISQSALSIQIRKLEGQLGQDLFERSGRQSRQLFHGLTVCAPTRDATE